jgi:Icc-related predicted phosphoesterase
VRVAVVSDVHGRADALPAAARGADALVCLGDFVLFLDYSDHAQGIMGSLFGADAVGRFVALRTARRYDEARELSRSLWAGLDGEREDVVAREVRRQYDEQLDALASTGVPTYLTFGNVDAPPVLREALAAQPGRLRLLDGEAVDIGGKRFGFVGGGLTSPMRTPYEVSEEGYAESLSRLGRVDVVAVHVPPALPELTYDVVARRFETGSRPTLDVVRRTQPEHVLFGHVHQPLAQRMRLGRTEAVNVGHFRQTRQPFHLSW